MCRFAWQSGQIAIRNIAIRNIEMCRFAWQIAIRNIEMCRFAWQSGQIAIREMHVLVRDILMLGSVENICASDSRRRPKYSCFGICGLYSCFRFTSPSETSWFWDLRIAFVLQIDIPATPPQPPPLPQPPCQTWPHLVDPCGILIVFNSVSDLAFFSRHPHFRDLR